MISIEKIEQASHILLVSTSDTFANASALYSFILTKHKKVSLQNSDTLEQKLSFLPWFEKCRSNTPSTADYIVEVRSDTQKYFEFFTKNAVKINKKMATALYAGLLSQYNAFDAVDCDGTIFATASKLLALQADKKICHDYMLHRVPLSHIRLKERLLASLLLQENATHAYVSVSEQDLQSSNTCVHDAITLMKEFLAIVHVREVTLFKSDENNKIINNIKEI